MEIVNSTLTALEEGKISVPEVQQLTSLALAKMNIESWSQEDKAEHEQRKVPSLCGMLPQVWHQDGLM